MNHRLTQLLKHLGSSPNDTFTLYSIAYEYHKSGDFELALDYYLKLLSVDPNYIGCYYHLGKVYEELEESIKAKSTYEKGISIAKQHNDTHAANELNRALENLLYEEDL